MEKLQNIELTIKDEKEQGVFAISFVDRPAIEEDFILLSEMEVEMKVIDENKREVIGLALVPNKKILRRHKDEETKKTTEFTVSFLLSSTIHDSINATPSTFSAWSTVTLLPYNFFM